MKSFLTVCLFLFSLALTAREVVIMDVKNNSKGDPFDYKLVLDVRGDDIKRFFVDSYYKTNPQKGIIERKIKSTTHIKTGFVLVERDGYNLIVVRSVDFIPDVGGTMELFYLNFGNLNPPGGTYHKRVLQLERYGKQWKVLDENNKEVSQAYLKVNKFFGKEVGISKIILN